MNYKRQSKELERRNPLMSNYLERVMRSLQQFQCTKWITDSIGQKKEKSLLLPFNVFKEKVQEWLDSQLYLVDGANEEANGKAAAAIDVQSLASLILQTIYLTKNATNVIVPDKPMKSRNEINRDDMYSLFQQVGDKSLFHIGNQLRELKKDFRNMQVKLHPIFQQSLFVDENELNLEIVYESLNQIFTLRNLETLECYSSLKIQMNKSSTDSNLQDQQQQIFDQEFFLTESNDQKPSNNLKFEINIHQQKFHLINQHSTTFLQFAEIPLKDLYVNNNLSSNEQLELIQQRQQLHGKFYKPIYVKDFLTLTQIDSMDNESKERMRTYAEEGSAGILYSCQCDEQLEAENHNNIEKNYRQSDLISREEEEEEKNVVLLRKSDRPRQKAASNIHITRDEADKLSSNNLKKLAQEALRRKLKDQIRPYNLSRGYDNLQTANHINKQLDNIASPNKQVVLIKIHCQYDQQINSKQQWKCESCPSQPIISESGVSYHLRNKHFPGFMCMKCFNKDNPSGKKQSVVFSTIEGATAHYTKVHYLQNADKERIAKGSLCTQDLPPHKVLPQNEQAKHYYIPQWAMYGTCVFLNDQREELFRISHDEFVKQPSKLKQFFKQQQKIHNNEELQDHLEQLSSKKPQKTLNSHRETALNTNNLNYSNSNNKHRTTYISQEQMEEEEEVKIQASNTNTNNTNSANNNRPLTWKESLYQSQNSTPMSFFDEAKLSLNKKRPLLLEDHNLCVIPDNFPIKKQKR